MSRSKLSALAAVRLDDGFGRVLARDIHSGWAVPGFPRAMMDGFALRAAQTEGASSYNPLTLQIVAGILPGAVATPRLEPGQAAPIMTGAPLPEGADAVLPVERTQVHGDQVWVMAPVPAQKHVGARGEDIQPGDRVLATTAEYVSSGIALNMAIERGVDVELIPDDEHGQIDVEAVADAAQDERVKLIALTHVPTNGGLVNPAEAVGDGADAFVVSVDRQEMRLLRIEAVEFQCLGDILPDHEHLAAHADQAIAVAIVVPASDADGDGWIHTDAVAPPSRPDSERCRLEV